MENMVLATPLLSDAATLSGSTSPAGLPVTNLQLMSISNVWRALDPENAYVVIDLGSAKEINLVALLGHNGSSRGTARVRAAATEADLTADPAYDSGLLPVRSHQSGYDAAWALTVDDEEYGALDTNNFLLWLGADTETFRFWRIDIDDTEIDYFDAGRLYVSKAWQPVTNMDYGLAEGFIDPSRDARTAGGKLAPVERPKYRWTEFRLSFATAAEMYDYAFEIDRKRGRTRDILFINDPDTADRLQKRTIYGTMKTLQPIINSQFSLFEKTYRIEEIIA